MFSEGLSQSITAPRHMESYVYPRAHIYDPSYPLFRYPESREIRQKRILAEEEDSIGSKSARTLVLVRGDQLIYKDTLIQIKSDTQVFIPKGVKYRVSVSSEVKANQFYDKAKIKVEKHWWSALLFSWVISYEGPNQGPDQVNEFKESQIVYYPYEGKTISEIHVKQVDVLEGSVDDTTLEASSV